MMSQASFLSKVTAGMALAFVSACGESAPEAPKKTTNDDALTCAALIYAVNSYVEEPDNAADADFVKSNAMSAITHYGTEYAKSKGLDGATGGVEALGPIKVKAMRMTGRASGGDEISDKKIVERARACVEAI